MAKAKKKLNTNFLLTAATIAVSLSVVAAGGGYFVYKSRRPDQLKAEGRELMQAGNYEDAFKRFSRAGNRKATDAEFLTWMQETESHLTSFDPTHYRTSYMLHTAIINASADKFPPTLRKLDADLLRIEVEPFDQPGAIEWARDLEATAKTVLDREPKNAKAYRARAYAKILPLYQAGASLSSAEVQSIVEALKAMLDEMPTEPDLVYRYAQSLAKLREAQIREMSIPDSPTSEQALALYKEYVRLSDVLRAQGNNEVLPVEERARAHSRAFELLQLVISLRLVPKDEVQSFLVKRLEESASKASTLMPSSNPMYLNLRLRHANFVAISKTPQALEEAVKILRETAEALPNQWQPLLALASALSEQGKPLEAVKVLSVEKRPSYDLVGIAGSMFVNDQDSVALRRAYFRLQSLAMIEPDKQQAEIARIEEDYKTAISKPSLGGESNPYALQVQAGLQEVRHDRTGALQTLNQALTKMSDTPQFAQLRMKILEQLITINSSLQQYGRAEEIAEMLVRAQPGDFVHTLQLIDFKIKNDKKTEAERMVEQAKVQWPDQPALAALSIRLLPDEKSRREQLDKIPEKGQTPERTRQLVEIKMKLASEGEIEPAVGEIAERFLKDNPDDYRVTLMYVQSLLKLNKKDEALRRISALRAKDPSDANLLRAEMVVKAQTPEQLQKLWEDAASKSSPLNAKIVEAQKALAGGNAQEYVRIMREAQGMDSSGAVTQSLFYHFMSNAKLDEAEGELDKLAKLNRDPAEIRTNRLRINLARASIKQAEGKTEESNKIFDQAANEANAMVAEMPQFSGAWIVKGLALNSRGQLNEAFEAFQSALTAQPNNTEALHYVVELAQATGRGDNMLRYIDAGKRIAPADPYFDEARLRYETTFGDPQKALEARVKQRDAAPDKESTWLILGQTYMEAAKKASDPAIVTDMRKKAIDTFTQAKTRFPGSPGFGLAAANVMNDAGDTAGAQKLVEELSADSTNAANPRFLEALGNYYLQVNQADKALEVMQKLLDSGKVNPDPLRVQMVQLYARTGQIEKALSMLDVMPDSPEAHELRINLLLGARRFDEANKLANSYLDKDKNVTTLLMASHTEAQANNIARSIDLANQAVSIDANNPNTHLYKAKAMMREQPPRNAEILDVLETVKKLAPSNVEARFLAADRLMGMKKVDEAVSELESVVRDVPGNKEATNRLIRAYLGQRPVPGNRIDAIFAQLREAKQMDVQLLSLETSIAVQRGDIPTAVRAAKEAAESDPNNIGLYRQLVDVMIRAKQYNEVLTDLDRIEAKNPNIYWTYMTRGIALHAQKKEADAAKNWDKALGMAMSLKDDSPTGEVIEKYAGDYGAEKTGEWLKAKMGDEPRMRALMVNLYGATGNLQKVIELGESLMPLPDSFNRKTKIMLLNSLGNAYLGGTPSQPQKARGVFEQLIAIDTDNPLALNNLAYAILLEGSDLTAATRYAEQAYNLTVKTGTPNAYVVDTYGWALVQTGKLQEGIEKLREASAIEDIADVAYHLGEAYIIENQKTAAVQSLEKSLVLIQNARNNKESVDSGLESRVKDALSRATAM